MFVQQGRRRGETGGVPSRYVEDFDEPRTTLADIFSILLGTGFEPEDSQHNQRKSGQPWESRRFGKQQNPPQGSPDGNGS